MWNYWVLYNEGWVLGVGDGGGEGGGDWEYFNWSMLFVVLEILFFVLVKGKEIYFIRFIIYKLFLNR